MKPRAAAALGVRPDDPSIAGEAHDPFLPDLRHPPIEWFFEPPEWMDDGTKIWIDSDGRAAGWYYHSGVCIIDGNEGECWSPSPSPTGNELFHQGSIIAMDAGTPTIVETGVIGGGGEHAPVWMTAEAAADYYADVTKQLLIGRIYDDPNRGGFFLGCVLPSVTNAQVDMIRRSALSGDWRWRRQDLAGHTLNGYDAIGPWLVTRPGLPLSRMGQTVMRLAAAGSDHDVILGGVLPPPEPDDYDRPDEGDLMAWHIEHHGSKFAVVESRTGTIVDLFATVDDAGAQLQSLYAPRSAAVIGDESLPLAGRDDPWDGAAALQRVEAWAGGDPAKLSRAFLYRDDAADPSTIGAYKLGYADVVNGELHAFPRGIFAVAGVLSGARGGADIPAAEQDRIRAKVSTLYAKMADKFADPTIVPPWDQGNQGAADMTTTETAAPAPPPPDATPPPAKPAADGELAARVDGLEQRVADLEAMCAEMMTADLSVDEIMPADQMMGG